MAIAASHHFVHGVGAGKLSGVPMERREGMIAALPHLMRAMGVGELSEVAREWPGVIAVAALIVWVHLVRPGTRELVALGLS